MSRSIMICGPGRCGSHWLLYMLHRITGLQMRPPTVDPPPLEGYVWGTREQLKNLPDLVGKLDIVFLLRDPRDVETSMRQYPDPAVFRKEADAIVRNLGWYRWFLGQPLDELRGLQNWVGVCRYEDLLRDTTATVHDLLHYELNRWAGLEAVQSAVAMENARAPDRELSGRYREYWSERKLAGFMDRFQEEMQALGY